MPTTKQQRATLQRIPRRRSALLVGAGSAAMLLLESPKMASRLNPLPQRSGNATKAIEIRAAFRPFFAGGHSCQQRSSNAGDVIEARTFGPALCGRAFTPDAVGTHGEKHRG
jgi:hypothetical protein